MIIKSIEIENFRNFGKKIVINNLKKINTVIGWNGSGKSNLIQAIRKVVDLEERRKGFEISDSFQENKENILIKLIFKIHDYEDMDITKKTFISEFVDKEKDEYLIYVKLIGEFNQKTDLYENKYVIGNLDIIEKNYMFQTPIDHILDVIFLEPNYDYLDSFKKYKKSKKNVMNESETKIGNSLKVGIDNLMKIYSDDPIIKEMDKEINSYTKDNAKISQIFSKNEFKISPDLYNEDIFKNLKIKHNQICEKNNNFAVQNIGDGKTKILTYILRILTKKSEKIEETKDVNKFLMILVEEPENNLFFDLQTKFIDFINNVGIDQLILTTHSSFIINFNKGNNVVKITYNNNLKNSFIITKDSDIGYLFNEKIARGVFYEEIILIEGESENLFYDWMSRNSREFRKILFERNIYFLPILGINFEPYYDFFIRLGIRVKIKTDNDLTKVKNDSNKYYYYSGFSRMENYLGEEKLILGNRDKNRTDIFKKENVENYYPKISDIVNKFKQKNIYFQKHNKGFEKDFVDFVLSEDLLNNSKKENEDEIIEYLKLKKQKNLFEYLSKKIDKNKIKELKINKKLNIFNFLDDEK